MTARGSLGRSLVSEHILLADWHSDPANPHPNTPTERKLGL